MACSVAGITSDANVLTSELRVIAQRYLLTYGDSIPCEQLVSWLCDIKQAYTQYGGKNILINLSLLPHTVVRVGRLINFLQLPQHIFTIFILI